MLAAAHGELVRFSSAVIGAPWLVVTVIARVPSVGRSLVAGVPTSLRLVLAVASCGVQRQVSCRGRVLLRVGVERPERPGRAGHDQHEDQSGADSGLDLPSAPRSGGPASQLPVELGPRQFALPVPAGSHPCSPFLYLVVAGGRSPRPVRASRVPRHTPARVYG